MHHYQPAIESLESSDIASCKYDFEMKLLSSCWYTLSWNEVDSTCSDRTEFINWLHHQPLQESCWSVSIGHVFYRMPPCGNVWTPWRPYCEEFSGVQWKSPQWETLKPVGWNMLNPYDVTKKYRQAKIWITMDMFLFKGQQRSHFFHFLDRVEDYTDVTFVSESDLTQKRLRQGGSKREGLGQEWRAYAICCIPLGQKVFFPGKTLKSQDSRHFFSRDIWRVVEPLGIFMDYSWFCWICRCGDMVRWNFTMVIYRYRCWLVISPLTLTLWRWNEKYLNPIKSKECEAMRCIIIHEINEAIVVSFILLMEIPAPSWYVVFIPLQGFIPSRWWLAGYLSSSWWGWMQDGISSLKFFSAGTALETKVGSSLKGSWLGNAGWVGYGSVVHMLYMLVLQLGRVSRIA